jgi:hypothetical protein
VKPQVKLLGEPWTFGRREGLVLLLLLDSLFKFIIGNRKELLSAGGKLAFDAFVPRVWLERCSRAEQPFYDYEHE